MTTEGVILERLIRPLAPIPTAIAPSLERMQPFAAMLFDVYGTLLISGSGDIGVSRDQSIKTVGLHDLLERYGIKRTADDLAAEVQRAVEKGHAEARQRGIDHPEVDILRIWKAVLGCKEALRLRLFALEYELMVNPVYPMPGLNTLLSSCRARGLPMGIISNAQFYTPCLLERFLGSPPEKSGFDPRLIFLSYRFGYAKPSIYLFERAADALAAIGIAAETALYVGNDMLNDIRPASTVGFKTALFAGDGRSLRMRAADDRCRGLSPDLIVTDLRQLIAGTVDP